MARFINHLLVERSKLEEEVAKLNNTLKQIIKRVTPKPSKKIKEYTIKLVKTVKVQQIILCGKNSVPRFSLCTDGDSCTVNKVRLNRICRVPLQILSPHQAG